ncbi:MAG: hypothetical protein WD875_00580 [Pirellulales bacterium]
MSVAACPRCEGQITLPPGGRPAAQVKCPLCEEEFALSEVYAKLPPMLILLESPVEAYTGQGGMTHGGGAFDNLFMPSADANGEGDLHLAPADGEGGGSSFDFGGSGGGTAVATAPTTKTMPARAKRPPKSPVKEGVKIVLGGVVGLAAGYFILLWGFNRDLCMDVAKKPVAKVLPTWMYWSLPAGHKPAAAAQENEGDKAPDVGAPDDGAADGDAANADANNADGDVVTGTPADDAHAKSPGDGTDTTLGGAADTGAASDDATDAAKTPGDITPTPPMPKADGVDDPGFNPPPTKPSIDIGGPSIEIPKPSSPPPVDAPKISDLFPGEDTDKPADDKPADDAPADDAPPADKADDNDPAVEKPAEPAAEDNPFDIPPVATDGSDKPADKPADAATDDPVKPEPKEPVPGLKIDAPADEATIDATRSAANAAADALMPGDAVAKAAFTRTKYESFAKVCEFADSVSRSATIAEDPDVASATAVVKMIATDDADARTLGQLANYWLSKTRPNDGITLFGKVTAVDTAGGLTTITVELPALEGRLQARTATIVTRENAAIKADDEVAAVGTVIDKPAEKIEGYAGADSQVIWGAWVGHRGGE